MEDVLQLRTEYIYDPESRNWCFRVPSLGIIGGGETREEAEQAVLAAIRFTLEDDEPPAGDADVEYVRVAIGGRG
jgi:hypothetical protein